MKFFSVKYLNNYTINKTMDRKITQIGGSLGVTIPSKIIKKTKFFDGAKVSFRVVNDSSIMITLINSEAEKMGRRAQRRVIKED